MATTNSGTHNPQQITPLLVVVLIPPREFKGLADLLPLDELLRLWEPQKWPIWGLRAYICSRAEVIFVIACVTIGGVIGAHYLTRGVIDDLLLLQGRASTYFWG